MLLRMKPSSLPGFVLGWHAPPARGVARTGKPPPQKKIDKPNRHYRHLIHELWGNPQNSWRSSTLFLFFFFLFTHSPFTFCNLTGHRCFGAGRRGRRPNEVSVFHAYAPTNTHAHTQQQQKHVNPRHRDNDLQIHHVHTQHRLPL